MRRGFAPIIVVAIVAAFLIGIGATVTYIKLKPKNLAPTQQTTSNPSPVPSTDPEPSSAADETANWKTYKSKDSLYQISYPTNWTVDYSGGSPKFVGDNKDLLQIITWSYSDKNSVEEAWQSSGCGGSDPNGGCVLIPNKEVSKKKVNGYDVYIKVDNNNQMHGFIPNTKRNKTVEIASIFLKDRMAFNQILSTFQFTN